MDSPEHRDVIAALRMSTDLYEASLVRAVESGFPSLSAYLRSLLGDPVSAGRAIQRERAR
jgi:hypothetical protein